MEYQKDWDEEIPLILFAAREVTKELVFCHTVHGFLKLLKDKWLANQSSPTNVLDFVCSSRSKGKCDLTKRNLGKPKKR